MTEIALHAIVALIAFIAALYIEHYRVWILSRLLFWRRRTDLIGTYETTWTVEHPSHVPVRDDGTPAWPATITEHARVEWASASYLTGTATSPSYGDYVFHGRVQRDAITLSYFSKEEKLRAHLGVVVLRFAGNGVLAGRWIQNRPDYSAVLVGTVRWKKRDTPH
jgi:hypothetical protein